jgi:hypothetical protein
MEEFDVPSNPSSLENDDERWLIGQFDCKVGLLELHSLCEECAAS